MKTAKKHVSYKSRLINYLETKDKAYLEEYPEFEDFTKYLKPTEINSLQFNKEKMMKAVLDKKQMDIAFQNLNLSGFISNKDLKAKIKSEFERLGITLAAKASLIRLSKVYSNYSAPPMGMSNRLTVVLQQELH